MSSFTDDQGARWRVYDVAFGPLLAAAHKRKVLAPGDTRARYRLFVPPDPAPMLRIHDFGKTGAGDRSLTVEVLGVQLARGAGLAEEAHAGHA